MTLASKRVTLAKDSFGQRDKGGVVPWGNFALLIAASAVALRPLVIFWKVNPEYAFGWAVIFLARYLFFERWKLRPAINPVPLPPHKMVLGLILIAWGTLLLFALLLAETEPDWRPALWLDMSLVVAAWLAWLWLSGGAAWLRHFWTPIAFLFLSVPWIFNFEFFMAQGLMRLNASLVVGSLEMLDVPAETAGNTIVLATGRLGVEEACSGIRSLQAAVMMSFFLGEFYFFSISRRALLLGLAAGFAFVGNYARLFFLGWEGARHEISSVEKSHASAGTEILLCTVLALWGICLALRKQVGVPSERTFFRANEGSNCKKVKLAQSVSFWAAGVLLATLFGQIFTYEWYAWREQAIPSASPWRVVWPVAARNFKSIPLASITHDLLRDTESKTGTWTDGQGWRWTALWFQYKGETASRIVFNSHTPDVCLPAVGLRETGDFGDTMVTNQGRHLQFHAYLFDSISNSIYVFWIVDSTRGRPALLSEHELIYGHSIRAFFERSFSWCVDAWRGVRNPEAETLEVSIEGPANEENARRAYLQFLNGAIIAGRSVSSRDGQ